MSKRKDAKALRTRATTVPQLDFELRPPVLVHVSRSP